MTVLGEPTFTSIPDYGSRLDDASFWTPYVFAALARHGLPREIPQAGAVGTYPTFIAGKYVVKLFGELFSGGEGYEIERSLYQLFLGHPDIPIPRLVAEGRLFETGWPWPYLITTRVDGMSCRDAALDLGQRADLARQLGKIIRRVHALSPPTGPTWVKDRLVELRAGCVERHRQWGTLPRHLIDQIDRFLNAPSTDRCLVHADLHQDHLFVTSGTLVGIIDWGDAMIVDPYYELPALHFGTFGADKSLLRAFLESYGWPGGSDSARRAMTMTLQHEFDVLRRVSESIDFEHLATLDELANQLWAV